MWNKFPYSYTTPFYNVFLDRILHMQSRQIQSILDEPGLPEVNGVILEVQIQYLPLFWQ